jgi:hypothetical protein
MRDIIIQRAYDAFGDDDAEKAQRFLDIIMASWKDISGSIRRVLLLIMLLIAAFELSLIPAAVKSLVIGPLSFGNTSLVRVYIPVLFSYLVYYEVILSEKWSDHADLYRTILYRFQPKLAKSLLMLTVHPIVPGPWDLSEFSDVYDYSRFSKSERFDHTVGFAATFFAFLIFPLAFDVQAYYELVNKYGAHNISIIVSIILSSLLVTLWITRYAIGLGEIISQVKRRVNSAIAELEANPETLVNWDIAQLKKLMNDLAVRERERGLSGAEKDMLDKAKQLRQQLDSD